jgi:hypothetical protein
VLTAPDAALAALTEATDAARPQAPGRVDLRVVTRVCRAHGRGLLGAAPAALLGEVPAEWVLAVGDAQLADWEAIGDDPEHAELTVLTTCRVWRFAEERRRRLLAVVRARLAEG